MAIAAEQFNDVRTITQGLLEIYGPGLQIDPQNIPMLDDIGAELLEFDLFIDTEELATATAWLSLLKMSTDAASVAVEFIARDGRYDPDDAEELLEELLGEDLIGLELLILNSGSLRARFKINPKTRDGRRRSIAIVGLVGLVLLAVAPAVGVVVTTGATAAGYINDIVTPDEVHADGGPAGTDAAAEPAQPPTPEIDPDSLESVESSDLAGAEEVEIDFDDHEHPVGEPEPA